MFGRRPRRRVLAQVVEARRKQIYITGGLAILLILVIGGFFVWLSHFDRLRIDSISVSGQQVVKAEEVKQIALDTLKGNYLWMFAKENTLIYPENAITNNLFAAYPRIKDIVIERDGLNALVIGIEEYEPHALWCGNVFNGTRDPTEQCYFTDTEGYIFALAPDFSGSAYFKYYGILSEDLNPIRQTLFDGFERTRLEDFLRLLETVGFDPHILSWTQDGDYITYLKQGGEIRFAKKDNFKHVFENLQSLIDVDPFKSDYKENADRLEYVDLRFGNKVLYRFRD